jgi:ATP-dependent DNA ligase
MASSKAEKLFARYKRNPTGKRGSPEEWAKAAQALQAKATNIAAHLAVFGFSTLPTQEELSKARKKAMLTAHPDKGGTTEEATKINEAFMAISALLEPAPFKESTKENQGKPFSIIHPPRCDWELPENLDDPNLVADIKIDGERAVMYLHLNPYTGERVTTLLTRHVSKHTNQYGTRKLAHFQGAPESLEGTILDGELFQGDYIAFDIPFYKGQDLRNRPLWERKQTLALAVKEIDLPNVKVVEFFTGNLKKHFERVTGAGGEGLVVKDKRAAYGNSWAKLKKSYDVSCVITGFRDGLGSLKGYVGSFLVSIYKEGKLVEVGAVKLGKNSLHEEVTKNKMDYLGRVIDVFIQELTVHEKFRHATFFRFRDDVNPEDCTLEKVKKELRGKAKTERSHEEE